MKYAVLLLISISLLVIVPHAEAAKPRMRSTGAKNTTATANSYSKAKLSRSTNSVLVTFINLGKVSRVTYTLSYKANGIEQGAMGSLVPSGATESRDLYFGTCSHGVCTQHRGIQQASLIIETQLSSGKINTKRYRIRI